MATHPTEYAHPEALVETDWLEKHLKDEGIRIVESNEDVLLYATGHIPGAVHIDWRADLQDPVIRDYISPEKFAELCSRNGITPDTTCIFYGDKANWWACYALWAFRLFGHGKRPRMTTAHSSQRQNWRKFISINAESVLKRTLLSIAESASVPVTPGSCSPISLD